MEYYSAFQKRHAAIEDSMDETLWHYTTVTVGQVLPDSIFSDIFHYIKLIDAKNGGFQGLGREENEELYI